MTLLSLEYLEAILRLVTGLASILFCLRELFCLSPKGRQKDGEMAGWLVDQSEHIQHISIKSSVLHGHGL